MAWREVLGRSFDHLKNESAKGGFRSFALHPCTSKLTRSAPVLVLRASPLGPRPERELNLASLRSPQDMKQFIAGCDRDIGGMSKVSLELDSSGRGMFLCRSVKDYYFWKLVLVRIENFVLGRFYGTLNAYVPPGLKVGNATVDRSGYAGMRTRVGFLVSNIYTKRLTMSKESTDPFRLSMLGHDFVRILKVTLTISTSKH